MAGLAGIIYPDTFQVDHTLETMLQTIEHRGPNLWDTFNYKSCYLGSRGRKIASNDRKTIFAMIDGHIYNSTALYLTLQREGFHFSNTGSEAELIIHAYEAWKDEFPTKIDGDFAIALYDKNIESLVLVRDRMGAKPLYWYEGNHFFIFCSEMKGLMATGIIPQTPSVDSMVAFLKLGFIPQDMSPIEDVNKLLPGYCLHFSHHKGLSIHPYWSLSSHFTADNPQSRKRAAEELDQRLRSAILARTPKLDHVGCFVSGGLGSASVAYYLQDSLMPDNIIAYTVGFEGENEEDVDAAKIFSKTLKLQHEVELLSPDNFLDEIVKILWFLEEPIADPNIFTTWNLAKLASKEQSVIFSGMGSDELLTGHNRYTISERRIPEYSLVKRISSPFLHKVLLPILNYCSRKFAYSLIKEFRSDPWQSEYLKHNAVFEDKEITHAFPTFSGMFNTDTFLSKFTHLNRILSPVSSFRYLDIKTRLPDYFILQYDRITAAFNLDWRSPYFDKGLIEFLCSFPEPTFLKESEAAFLLKTIFADTFPKKVLNRPKRTRKHLLEDWVEKSELPTLFHMLNRGSLIETGLLTQSWLNEKTASVQTMKRSFRLLWTVLILEIWFRTYINFPVTQHPPEARLIDLLTEV
ncbi:MAG: asparagine synthase (glutamine-hydrolyzing) [Chlamydiales bacterium]